MFGNKPGRSSEKNLTNNVYVLALAGMLSIGSVALPTEEPSADTAAVSRQVVVESHGIVQEDPAIYPLAVSLPSDFDTEHVEWCSKRYRSYNPRDNSWVSYGGKVRECDSPFW
ncbi:MAG TPA: BA14K family protein [Candidatus Saccharimonadales bacterium]|nr:BA14K family protein [Candidatus Saccharimonadales bacterium]